MNSTSPKNTDTSSSRWYQNISDLPLAKYIDVVVNNNLSALIISGFPTPEQLAKAWEEISFQYADTLKEADYRIYSRLCKELALLELWYDQLSIMLATLAEAYHPWLKDRLNHHLKTKYIFDVTDRVAYDKDLQSAFNRGQGTMIMIELKRISVEELRKKFTGSSKPISREYFHTWLITLSDHAGYRITEDITVFEFCERIHRALDHHDKMKKKNGK